MPTTRTDQTARFRAVAALGAYGAEIHEGETHMREYIETLISTLVEAPADPKALERDAMEAYRNAAFDPVDSLHAGLAAEAVEALEAVIGKDADAWGGR